MRARVRGLAINVDARMRIQPVCALRPVVLRDPKSGHYLMLHQGDGVCGDVCGDACCDVCCDVCGGVCGNVCR